MKPTSHWESLYDQLQWELREQGAKGQSPLFSSKTSIATCGRFILQLKGIIVPHSFAAEAEEIYFFKVTKPAFYSEYIYWLQLYNLHLREPVAAKGPLLDYWGKALHRIQQFYKDHAAFYCYYRSGRTDLDDRYYLRSALSHHQGEELLNLDPGFNTYGDYYLSRIQAHERLVRYINAILHDVDRYLNQTATPTSPSPLQWTASKTDLVELIYALQVTGVFNNGQATVKEIVALLEPFFGQQLGNYYNTFNEMRLRKKLRLPLLDSMQKKLVERMDNLDS